MSNNQISNLRVPYDALDAANKDYVDKSFITPSGPMKNVLQYIMDDINETSTEFGATVSGIVDFPQTPHLTNKKAIKFEMQLQSNNNAKYYSRIGINMYPLPTGPYTFVIEFFPPTTTKVEVNCVSSTINVDREVVGRVGDSWKNVAWITKYVTTPNEYLMLDLKCAVDPNSSDKLAWLIVWGIGGHHSNVPSTVYDRPYVVENGRLIMETNVDMSNHVMQNLPFPTAASQAAPKEYVDISGIYTILRQATATFIDGYIKQIAECLYAVDRGTKEEVVFSSSRAISTLVDQTLSELNATQFTPTLQPKLSTAKNEKRFFFTFDGAKRMLSNIDLNPATGDNDIVHVFILFRLATHAGSNQHFRNGLFGHDNAGWDKFVVYNTSQQLLISGTTNQKTLVTASDWQSKANASELNKWCCLSIHWDVPAGAGKSSCWVNGKKVKDFQARTSSGSNQMTFGDLDPNGIAGLNGDIQLFLLYKGWGMAELIIKAHHKMICERYGVDHDEISFP